MDGFGVLTERYGIKPQGKSAPMAASRQNNGVGAQARNFASNSSVNTKSSSFSSNSGYDSNSIDVSFLDDQYTLFGGPNPQNSGGLGNDFEMFGDLLNSSKQTNNGRNGSSVDHNSFFANSSFSNASPSLVDDFFGGLGSSNSASNNGDFFWSSDSKPNQSSPANDLLGGFGTKLKTPEQNGSVGYEDLIPGFAFSAASSGGRDNVKTSKSSDDPFSIFETTSTTTKSTFSDPLEGFDKFNHSGSSNGSSKVSTPLKPPPKPGQVLKAHKVKSSDASFINGLEDFATGRMQNNANGYSNIGHAKEKKHAQGEKSTKYKEAEDVTRQTQPKSPDDVEYFFGMSSRSSSVPKSRGTNLNPLFDVNLNNKGKPERKSSGAPSSTKNTSSALHIVDDLFSMFGDAQWSGEFEEIEGESEERRRARWERYQRTKDRMERAVADMNQRDRQTQHEQEERRRIADEMDFTIKRWAAGKEGNMRALLSSLQYVLWPECGWKPVSIADLITSVAVKKVYRKAALCVHPDKVQQKGATLQQKYTAEKVFDILKEAWNKFNIEEPS